MLNDDTLYQVYPIMSRLEDTLVRKYRNLNRASKAYGKHGAYFYNIVSAGKSTTIQRLNDYARFADVSLAWLLYGDNLIYGGKTAYNPVNLSFSRLVTEWKALPHSSGKLVKDSVYIYTLMHHKSKTIRLTTLFYFADMFRLSVMDLCQD